MDNQTHNSENEWVDKRLASLVPPGDWHPESKRALAQILKRQGRPEAEGSGRWVRLTMAAAVLASIGLVVTLLPWQALWKGSKGNQNRNSESAKSTPMATVPKATPPTPAPASPELGLKPVERIGSVVTPPRGLAPKTEPQDSDEARRAHIQGTVAAIQQPSPPAPEQEQKPVEHVGPGVTAPRVISSMSEPDYTDEARQAHIQGTVVLSVIVRADGTAKVDKVVRGLGYGLDEKAIATVERWKFAPATKDGKPVDVQLQIVINFHLY